MDIALFRLYLVFIDFDILIENSYLNFR
uniref:Uncharacterized protein n=1 Tax=Arundo donax TaxID=35708 RepID=A0A0A8ZGT7_ARUDO